MTTLFRFRVVEKVMLQIFSCFASGVIEVNQTVVRVRFITERLGIIVVMGNQRLNHLKVLLSLNSVLEQQKMENGVKIRQPIPAEDAIDTK
jgi:hypothetical protein